jgi:hypothetical protein
MFFATAAKTRPGGKRWFPADQRNEKMVIDCAQNPPEKLDRRVLR